MLNVDAPVKRGSGWEVTSILIMSALKKSDELVQMNQSPGGQISVGIINRCDARAEEIYLTIRPLVYLIVKCRLMKFYTFALNGFTSKYLCVLCTRRIKGITVSF